MRKESSSHTFHKTPEDIKKILYSSQKLSDIWDGLTPLARNEWICWITSVKKDETRKKHIKRAQEDLLRGKKRPCCWAGCPHRSKNKTS